MKTRLGKLSKAVESFFATLSKDGEFNKDYFVLSDDKGFLPIGIYCGGGKTTRKDGSAGTAYKPNARVIFVTPAEVGSRNSIPINDDLSVREGFTIYNEFVEWFDTFLPDDYVELAKAMLEIVNKLVPATETTQAVKKAASVF